jgi:hypothetical protein
MHTGVLPLQTLPHPPQLFGSLLVSTHESPHTVLLHTQVQLVMTWPPKPKSLEQSRS